MTQAGKEAAAQPIKHLLSEMRAAHDKIIEQTEKRLKDAVAAALARAEKAEAFLEEAMGIMAQFESAITPATDTIGLGYKYQIRPTALSNADYERLKALIERAKPQNTEAEEQS